MSNDETPTPPSSPVPDTPPAPGGPGTATEPPAYVPGEEEQAAHAELVRNLVPAASRRISVIIRSVIETCMAGDYAIFLPLFALHTGLHELVLDKDATGATLPPAAALKNEAKLYLLASIVFARYADLLRLRALSLVDTAAALPDSIAPIAVEWGDADTEAAYVDALAEFTRILGEHHV
jgi:hypothetical protein